MSASLLVTKKSAFTLQNQSISTSDHCLFLSAKRHVFVKLKKRKIKKNDKLRKMQLYLIQQKDFFLIILKRSGIGSSKMDKNHLIKQIFFSVVMYMQYFMHNYQAHVGFSHWSV